MSVGVPVRELPVQLDIPLVDLVIDANQRMSKIRTAIPISLPPPDHLHRASIERAQSFREESLFVPNP
jgi:hypothetical protein